MSDRLDDPRPDDALQTAARALARSARLAVFTGAGVSKESGIATFREPETGLWAQYDPMQLATPEAYEAGPGLRLELVRAPVRRRRRRPSPTRATTRSPSSSRCCRGSS